MCCFLYLKNHNLFFNYDNFKYKIPHHYTFEITPALTDTRQQSLATGFCLRDKLVVSNYF